MGGRVTQRALGISDYAEKINGGIPFAMAYGTEAIILLEVGIPGIRTQGVENGTNDVLLARDLDLLEERREKATIQLAAYQQ